MNKAFNKKTIILALIMGLPYLSFAQEAAKGGTTYFSNALFNSLLAIIILLLTIVWALSNALKSIINSDTYLNKIKKENNDKNKIAGLVALFSLASLAANAQNTGASAATIPAAAAGVGGIDNFTFYSMICIIAIEATLIFYISSLIKSFLKLDTPVKTNEFGVPVQVKEKTIMDKLNASVDLDKEEEIMLDHDYDGIKELDNNLPPWWKYGFYLTIISGVIYLMHYHVLKTGDLQTAEYNKEVAEAKLAQEEYLKNSANNVDESTVKMLSGSDLDLGKEAYKANCAVCHGENGQGKVGPNLTDNYWLHSGSLQDIFKSIKYGWTDKGMKAWKEELSPMQIAQLSSYIKTLAGTNPADPKAPQGELYVDPTVKTDSLQLGSDSLKLSIDSLKKDSLKIKK